MKKNGFVSTTLIYTFFILFLVLMIFLLNSYSSTRFLLEQYRYNIKDSFVEKDRADINLYLMVWDETTSDYELQEDIPSFGYYFEDKKSYCEKDSTLSYIDGSISVTATRKDSCYAFFRTAETDIVLRIYTKESSDSDRILVKNVPSYVYDLTSQNCTKGTIAFNEQTRKFKIQSTEKTVCEVEFTKKEMDIVINIYKQDAYGNHDYNGFKYTKVDDVPGINFVFDSYYCKNNDVITNIKDENGELFVESSGKNECNVYYNGGNNNVELIIMQETDTGVSGYTTGLKYTKTGTIPGVGYKYVGYLCDNPNASVSIENGTPVASMSSTSTSQAICRAYYNRYSGNVFINYYLETSTGNYENVSSVPSIGYIYNENKSKCNNNSNIIVDNNNIVTIESSQNEECDIYFDMANADIRVNVYVMNRETNKYELSSVPVTGYELYNAGCTNGSTIEYINGYLQVTSEGPTVCTVYFR